MAADTDETTSTREAMWAEICKRHRTPEARMAAWVNTPLIDKIPDDEWSRLHAGSCGLCKADGARLYPNGWRCDNCKPGQHPKESDQ